MARADANASILVIFCNQQAMKVANVTFWLTNSSYADASRFPGEFNGSLNDKTGCVPVSDAYNDMYGNDYGYGPPVYDTYGMAFGFNGGRGFNGGGRGVGGGAAHGGGGHTGGGGGGHAGGGGHGGGGRR
jgi:hypothetical protein